MLCERPRTISQARASRNYLQLLLRLQWILRERSPLRLGSEGCTCQQWNERTCSPRNLILGTETADSTLDVMLPRATAPSQALGETPDPTASTPRPSNWPLSSLGTRRNNHHPSSTGHPVRPDLLLDLTELSYASLACPRPAG